jgi:outer membrane receptor for ferrienterochelin and colicins
MIHNGFDENFVPEFLLISTKEHKKYMNHLCAIPIELIRMNKHCMYLLLVLLILIPKETFAQTDSMDIYDLSLTQLSELKITSVTKAAQNLSEVPSTILVITATEIQEKGYFTLEEALSDLPGFQFRNIQGINSYVFQRGIPNQNNLTLVLIDGVQVNELNSGGFYGGGQYNLSNVERIEVIYGPASVVYGTNAVTGIINIVTKSALEKKCELNLLAGSFNTSKIDFNYCYVNEEKSFGISTSGMLKKTEKADLKGRAGDYNWTDLMDNFENDYSFDLKIQASDFILGTNLLYKQASTATWVKSVGTIYRDYGTSWNILFINNYIKYCHTISEKLTYSSILYNRNATVLGNTIYYVVDTAQIGYYRPNNLIGLENVLNYDVSNLFSLTGGLTLEYEQLAKMNSTSYSDSPEQKPPTPVKPPMVKNYLTSIFVEPRIALFESLYLSGGVRFDHSSIYDQVLTPRVGLSYNFRDHILRFSYAEAFRAPKPWDYTDGMGNSSLLPERMKSLETSITLSVADNYKVDLVGYKNSLEHAIVKEITDEGYRWVNSGKVNTDGFEISLQYASHKLKSSLNYTFNQSYNEFNEFVPEISKHCGNASVTYSFSRYFKINIRANYIGKRENSKIIVTTNSKFIEPCLIFHSTFSLINYKGFGVQFSVKNIFNTEYYHTSNREPDRYRQPQRTVMVSVGYALND